MYCTCRLFIFILFLKKIKFLISFSNFKGFPVEFVELFKKLKLILKPLEEKNNNQLKVSGCLLLLEKYLEWFDDYALFWGHEYVTSKIQKLEHMIIEVILVGKFWTHSCFSFETNNIIIKKGVKGTSMPLPSIIRTWRKLQYLFVWNWQLEQHKSSVEKLFPTYSSKLFDKNTIPNDKNPNLLTKITNKERTIIQFWLETCVNKTSNYCNYIIQFFFRSKLFLGEIIEIIKQEHQDFVKLRILDVSIMLQNQLQIFSIDKRSKNSINISTNNIISFFCLTKFAGKEWIFSFVDDVYKYVN